MDVILYSAGGHSKSVSEIIYKLDLNIISYAEKSKSKWLKNIPMISDDEIKNISNKAQIVIGLGGTNPKDLKKRINKINSISKFAKIASLIDPSALIAKDAKIEEGVVIMPGAIIRSGTTIKKYSIINSGAIIEHDCRIGIGTHVAPGAIILGSTICGNCCMIAAGSIITPGKNLQDYSFIKAGKVI
jgi:sugar O-acyltransferase (sialic acid O-acetyltransferase NeuD family)